MVRLYVDVASWVKICIALMCEPLSKNDCGTIHMAQITARLPAAVTSGFLILRVL